MRPGRLFDVFCALLLASATVRAQNLQPPQKPLRILVTADEAHGLPLKEAALAYPVHLRAVVTYYDPFIDARHGALFVHDQTGSIFVSVPKVPILKLRGGDLVEVSGVSGAGDFAPVVDHGQVRVIGHSHVPEYAPKATMQQLVSGGWDGRWVEIEGVVHAVHSSLTNASLEVATVGGPVTATTVLEEGQDYQALVDSFVRIHANAAPVFNRKRQMVGVHLFFPSLEEVKVVKAAPADPFAVEALSVSDLLGFTPGMELPHRVHVRGTVTLQWPSGTLCLQQASGGFCMQNAQGARVRVGDEVDAIGFPAISEYKATLENATFRQVGAGGSPPMARSITSSQALEGDHDGELISIEGNFIGEDHANSDLRLILHSGGLFFLAVLPQDQTAQETPSWKEGSKLRLTGICSVQVSSETTNLGEGEVRPATVRILLRSIDDVLVLQAPSWWTTQHLLLVLEAVGVLSFAALAWIVVLRLQVKRQTKALRSSEERLRHMSEHDALTNLPNRNLLDDRLSMALKRAERFRAGLGLLMVDVDRFKEINDAFGHHAGDQVLRELARRTIGSVRVTDTVARIGGDEFIVLLPDLNTQGDANVIAAKIVSAVSVPIDVGTEHILVTVSVGVSTYPEGGSDAEMLLRNADAAMYAVKAQGGNSSQVYRSSGV